MNKEINTLKQLKVESESSFQPMIFAVGDSITSVKHFVVYCNDSKYNFGDPLEAFICCFAIHFPLNLKYQGECNELWNVIQLAFFNMEIQGSKKGKSSTSKLPSNVTTLVKYFRSIK